MRLLPVAVVVLTLGCASPLERLAGRIENTPIHEFGWVPPVTADLTDVGKRLSWAANYLNIAIKPSSEMGQTEYGVFSPDERTLYYNSTLNYDAQVAVIAHELAHALQPPGLTTPEREIFADTVSYLVIRPMRDDAELYAQYLARYKTTARQFLKLYEPQIHWAVRFLRMEGGDFKTDSLSSQPQFCVFRRSL